MVALSGNIGDHLIGNVYIKFKDEEDAQVALTALEGRFYAGKLIVLYVSSILPCF